MKKQIVWNEKAVTSDTVHSAKSLACCLGSEFYLAGGTALALQMGHRISLDLDLFSQRIELREVDRTKILSCLKNQDTKTLNIKEITDGTCHFTLHNTAVSLFFYPYTMIEEKMPVWHGLKVASVQDIGAMKLSAILGRGARKDFIDLYFLAKELGLRELLHAAKKKYSNFSEIQMQIARALVYFEDAEKEPMPRMLKKVEWDEVKSYFEKQVPPLMKKILKLG